MFRLLLALVMLPVLLCEVAVLRHQPLSAWALLNIAIYPLVTAAVWLARARANHVSCPLLAEADAAISAATIRAAAPPIETLAELP